MYPLKSKGFLVFLNLFTALPQKMLMAIVIRGKESPFGIEDKKKGRHHSVGYFNDGFRELTEDPFAE